MDGLKMQYRPGAGGDMLSVLGYGCMRFIRKGNSVDLDKAEKELMTAIEKKAAALPAPTPAPAAAPKAAPAKVEKK